MKSIFTLSLCCLILSASSAFGQEAGQAEAGFVPLFNGKDLTGWTSARSTGAGDWGPYSVNQAEKAIHVYAGREANSEQKTDCLNTDKEFSHFILKLEYKWNENRFKPRPEHDRDAGLLFHVHGDLTKVWPYCLEMQIGESPGDKPDAKGKAGRFHTGDLFVLRKDLRTSTPIGDDKKYSADGKRKTGRSVRTPLGVEKPKGEWNEMEIRVNGSEKATFILNGQVVLETFDFHFKDESGNKVALNKGRIGLQAEWADLMYRNIRIKDLAPVETSKTEASTVSWEQPFNGKDFTDWTQKNGTAKYTIEEGGVICGTTEPGSPNSFLCTNKHYGDFEMTFDVKVDTELNSGVQIRSATKPLTSFDLRNNIKFGRVFGPQVEIAFTPNNRSGYVYGEATGLKWLSPVEGRTPNDTLKDKQWNSYRILASGPRIQTWINGVAVEDLTHEKIYKTHPKGFIGLQVHSIGKNKGPYEVRWRNIRIRELTPPTTDSKANNQPQSKNSK